MQLATLLLTVDSEALPFVQLFRDGKRIDSFPLTTPPAGGSKPALFQLVADRVRGLKADGVLWTTEVWTKHGQNKNRPVHRHDNTFYDIRPERGEALAVFAATRDGRRLTMLRDFTRDAEGWPVLGQMRTDDRLPEDWRSIIAALQAPRPSSGNQPRSTGTSRRRK